MRKVWSLTTSSMVASINVVDVSSVFSLGMFVIFITLEFLPYQVLIKTPSGFHCPNRVLSIRHARKRWLQSAIVCCCKENEKFIMCMGQNDLEFCSKWSRSLFGKWISQLDELPLPIPGSVAFWKFFNFVHWLCGSWIRSGVLHLHDIWHVIYKFCK